MVGVNDNLTMAENVVPAHSPTLGEVEKTNNESDEKNRISNSGHLVDIRVDFKEDATSASCQSTGPGAPCLDKRTCLFVIRPKYVKNALALSPFREVSLGASVPGSGAMPLPHSLPAPSTADIDRASDEASATVNLSNTLGVEFEASREEVFAQFKEITRRAQMTQRQVGTAAPL
ncbi:hypothetical protein HRI_003131900 [Hibiscus trionum]|uniref:Uncharacterized protein n=1 Tax=Hibiscus trionum TaxID=183268 RepID=A0A9W7MBK1_HIBTR|nr:hypothetical protein HRI_003131900 [Hibiscus trionum]